MLELALRALGFKGPLRGVFWFFLAVELVGLDDFGELRFELGLASEGFYELAKVSRGLFLEGTDLDRLLTQLLAFLRLLVCLLDLRDDVCEGACGFKVDALLVELGHHEGVALEKVLEHSLIQVLAHPQQLRLFLVQHHVLALEDFVLYVQQVLLLRFELFFF